MLLTSSGFATGQPGCEAIEPGTGFGAGTAGAVCAVSVMQGKTAHAIRAKIVRDIGMGTPGIQQNWVRQNASRDAQCPSFPSSHLSLLISSTTRSPLSTRLWAVCSHSRLFFSDLSRHRLCRSWISSYLCPRHAPAFRAARFLRTGFLKPVPSSRTRQQRSRPRYPPFHPQRLLLRVFLSLSCSFLEASRTQNRQPNRAFVQPT